MKRIACKIKGHKFSSIKKTNILIKEYTCTHCNQKFTTDGYGQIVKLNSYWKENNILFERLLENRSA
jgi:5-methylcytosine-specific restriction endonuclease McrA